MRKFYTFYWTLLLLCSILSCQKNQQTLSEEEKTEKLKIENNKYNHLPDYEWLSNLENFSDKKYQEIFSKNYNLSLKEKKYENAAAYLKAYGDASKRNSSYDSAYVVTLLKFYEDNESKISAEAKTNLCHYIGSQYSDAGNLEKSFYWLEKGISFEPESIVHKQKQGFSHFAIAQNYLRQRNLDKTEKHLVEALKIFEEVGDNKNKGTVYLLMHNLYVQNRAYDKAEKILQKAVDIFKKNKDEFLTFSAIGMSAHFHIEQGDTLKTIKQIDELAKFSKTYKTIPEYHKGILNQFLAFKFIAQKKQDSAAHYLHLAEEISNQTAIPDLEMRTFFQEILFSNAFKTPLKDPEKVERFYKQMAQSEEPNTQYMFQLASALYDYYQKKGDYKKANEYSMFLVEDTNKQSKDRLKNQLFELETKFETEKKEHKILLQEKKISEKNTLIWLLIACMTFLVLAAVIILFWIKNKSILKEKKLTENFTSQLLQKTENERKRIASDLHDSVSNELVNLRHNIEENNTKLKTKIDNILEEVRNISRNISPILFDKIGLKLSVENMVERIQNQHQFFVSSEIDYKGGLDHDKELQVYRIIQEAITNILKHADAAAGKITVTEDSNAVKVNIKDNGKGFDVAKMFEKGNCFGLLNITERVKYLKGKVNFQSDQSGTIINIIIPKQK